ncbi:MAG: phage tail protein I [Pseudomonadota bacterium]|jgi:phage tail protein I|nr:phage tail protein I [Pseudomonadota bacterium]DAS71282.1 MAG TPA: tail protein [Caudoviricetes sp.]
MTNNKSILPPNATPLLKDIEETIALRLGKLNVPNRWLMHPDKCPVQVLPWLAWAVSVDVWNEDWLEDIRRNVIKTSVDVHRQKGTIGALKTALQSFNFDNVRVEEWFDYGADPYMFRVFIEIVSEGFDINDLTEVYAVIERTKNTRSHLDILKAVLCNNSTNPYIGASCCSGEITTISGKEIFEI